MRVGVRVGHVEDDAVGATEREVEADRERDVAVVGDHRLEVRHEVLSRLRLGVGDLHAQVGLRLRETLVRGLVEALVVPAALVRDGARQEVEAPAVPEAPGAGAEPQAVRARADRP